MPIPIAVLVLAVLVTACSASAPAARPPTTEAAAQAESPPSCGPRAAAVCNSSGCSGCPCTSWACVSTERRCSSDADCAEGEGCFCRSIGEDPCHAGMSAAECQEAQCNGRVCSLGPPEVPQ